MTAPNVMKGWDGRATLASTQKRADGYAKNKRCMQFHCLSPAVYLVTRKGDGVRVPRCATHAKQMQGVALVETL